MAGDHRHDNGCVTVSATYVQPMTVTQDGQWRLPPNGDLQLPFRLVGSCPALSETCSTAAGSPHWHILLTGARKALVMTRSFRAPHHPIAEVGLIGGGQGPRPGEGSRAPHGRLFVDARPACRRPGLEGRRQPLEEGVTEIQSRACPGSECFRSVSPPSDGREGFEQRTVVNHSYLDSGHAASAGPPLQHLQRLVFFA
jgi:Magnesium chelatase, subunit ChlI